jgi:arylsulfatase
VPAGRHALSCTYTIDADGPALTLHHDDAPVVSAALSVPVPMFWQHGGTALCIGHDRGLPVCDDYAVPFAFTGTVHEVAIDVGRQAAPDPRTEIRAALTTE